MTPENRKAGIRILSKYGKTNLRHELPYHATDILWEEVSEADKERLYALGWHAIDDWWGWEDKEGI